MTDGTRLNLGTDGDMAATDDISDAGVANGHKVQRVKAGWGTDGGYKDPNHTTPLPVDAYSEVTGLSAGGVLLVPKFAVIQVNTSGNNTIVSGVTDKKIRVLSYVISASGAVNVKWVSGTTPDKSGLLYISQTGGFVSGYCSVGHLETAASADLTLNLSANVAVGGHLTYVEIP